MQTGTIKEGQVWVDFNGTKRTIEKNPTRTLFIWRGVTDAGTYSTYNDLGQYSGTGSSYNDLKEMIMDAETNQDNLKSEPTKFVPPKPGDKIICNNGEEFICCTLEFLRETIYEGIKSDKPILGYRKFGYEEEWMDWDEEALDPEEYDIREVIPQNVEAPADKKEEVKEEPRYSLQEIKEAWDASGWVISTSAWEVFQKNLTKINSPEYQEYLRLRAIYE